MKDFSHKYQGKVVHFGLWSDEQADESGAKDALLIVQRAAKQTYDDDVRCEELDDALAYLEAMCPRTRPFKDFREALDMVDPRWRAYAARNALVRIQVVMSSKP